jgi:hypothetical protein
LTVRQSSSGALVAAPFASVDPDRWNAFADACPEAWLHHRSEHIAGAARLVDDRSFALLDGDEIVGLCPLVRLPMGIGAVLESPGLAMAQGGDVASRRAAALAHVLALGREAGCQAVQLRISPLAPAFRDCAYADSPLAAMGFRRGETWRRYEGRAGRRVPGDATLIDLTQDMAVVRAGFSKGHRANVSRGSRLGLQVRSDLTVFDDFSRVMADTHARLSAPHYPALLAFLKGLAEQGFAQLHAVYDGDNCLAAALVETYKGGAWYRLGGSTDGGLKAGAMTFLQHAIMVALKRDGLALYSPGISYPSLAGSQGGDVGDFKRRFGGRMSDDLSGELVLAPAAHALRILAPKFLTARGFAPRKVTRSLARALRRGRSRS